MKRTVAVLLLFVAATAFAASNPIHQNRIPVNARQLALMDLQSGMYIVERSDKLADHGKSEAAAKLLPSAASSFYRAIQNDASVPEIYAAIDLTLSKLEKLDAARAAQLLRTVRSWSDARPDNAALAKVVAQHSAR